ncbi:hypothetical protein ACFO0N_11225 [Halobium salinum]|uniref:DUF2283 domain-containing protein n=1 Tax=Halobium salinum TaxID=1364940 RepID=A0ABD5PC78_9EURY|nr:hypothetical protein [Halobium salinum]
MKVTYRTADDRERTVRCDAYEEFETELVCYDAEDEPIATIPRERVVSVLAESY